MLAFFSKYFFLITTLCTPQRIHIRFQTQSCVICKCIIIPDLKTHLKTCVYPLFRHSVMFKEREIKSFYCTYHFLHFLFLVLHCIPSQYFSKRNIKHPTKTSYFYDWHNFGNFLWRIWIQIHIPLILSLWNKCAYKTSTWFITVTFALKLTWIFYKQYQSLQLFFLN